jgi:hypothetical protein
LRRIHRENCNQKPNVGNVIIILNEAGADFENLPDWWGFSDRIAPSDKGSIMVVKIIVEKHPDGYVAYPLGLKGVVVGESGTYEDALSDVKSAIRFPIDTFGDEVFDSQAKKDFQPAFAYAADTLAHETIILQVGS